MNKLLLLPLLGIFVVLGVAARAAQPPEPAACVTQGESQPVVYEGRGLAFVPGGGVEPLIVRAIKAKPCAAS